MTTQLANLEDEPAPVAPAQDNIRLALEAGVDVAVLERLVALQERTEERFARAQFFRAKHDFQSLAHAIHKNRLVDHATRSGSRKTYTFADLPQIAGDIRGPLADCGLSYSWDVVGEQCVCVVSHVDGHSESTAYPIHVVGTGSNAAQDYAAGLMYAKRYSLTNALGIVTADPDTDANEVTGTPITEAQAITLVEHIHAASEDTKVPVADVNRRFLKVLAVDRLEDLDASRYEFALAKIQERR